MSLPSYQDGTVKFVDSGITAEEIKKAVEEAGYKIIKNKGENNMEKILNVEGMSCMHCVAHVKEALEKARRRKGSWCKAWKKKEQK